MGTTIKASIPVRGLYDFYLTYPQSITNPMLSIVRDVSAMFVEKTTFLHSSGAFMNIFKDKKTISFKINQECIQPKCN